MRLNALTPSENPMEELLFCFGGGGGGGGSDGGGGRSSHPGRPGGESGERGNRSSRGDGNDRDDRDRGGRDSNDNDRDGIPNSIDATPNSGQGTSYGDNRSVAASGLGSASQSVADNYGDAAASIGAGVDVFGPGGAAGRGYGPSGYGSDSNVGPAEGVGAPAGPGPSSPDMTEAEAISRRTGIPANTLVTGSDGKVVRSKSGAPVTSARSVAEAARDLGITPQEVTDRLGAGAGTDFGEGFGTGDTPNAVEQAIAGLGIGDVTQSPAMQTQMTPMGRAAQTYTDQAIDAFAAGDLAGRSPLASTAQQAAAAGPLAAAAEAFNAPTGIAAAAPGTADRGTTADKTGIGALAEGLGTTDNLPTGTTGVLAPGVGAAATPATAATTTPVASVEQAIANFSKGTAAGTPTPSTAATGLAAMPGYTGPSTSQQRMSNVAAMDNLSAQAAFERPFSPVPNMQIGGVEIPSLAIAGINAVGDVVNTLDMYGGGNLPGYMENVANRPAGTPVMSQGPKMSYAPGAIELSPLEQAMAEGSSNNVPIGPYSPAEGTQEVIGAIGPNNLGFLPGESDLIYVGDQQRFEQDFGADNNLGITDATPGRQEMTPMPSVGGDAEEQVMPETVAPVAPKTCPDGYTYDEATDSCVYQGKNIVQDAVYAPTPAPSYNYTGLPSLAPVKLRPSFQARGNYSPLFPTLPTS